MKILVVGTGGVGAAAAAVAQRRDFFERITFADLDPARPQALVERLDDGRFAAAQVDASDRSSVAALARDHDAVLNATDPRFNLPIFEAAFECRCTYLDMAMSLSSPDMLLGQEGRGWQQCTSELSLERSGPERYLSSHALFVELLRAAGTAPASETLRQTIGRMAAEIWTLRQMSLSVAGQLAAGRDPAVEAAVVKDLGNSFEQELPRRVQAVADSSLALEDDTPLARALALLLQTSPSFSLRGGTREILRGIIARGLGLR